MKYFPTFDDYIVISRKRTEKGVSYKILISIFYLYSAYFRQIEWKELSNLSNIFRIDNRNMLKYLSLSKELFIARYNRYKDKLIMRDTKIIATIGSSLGKLDNPILYHQVVYFYKSLKIDYEEIGYETMACLYILFYYRLVRGQKISTEKVASTTHRSTKYLDKVYYCRFLKEAKKELFKLESL
jgi:hypothetical protein